MIVCLPRLVSVGLMGPKLKQVVQAKWDAQAETWFECVGNEKSRLMLKKATSNRYHLSGEDDFVGDLWRSGQNVWKYTLQGKDVPWESLVLSQIDKGVYVYESTSPIPLPEDATDQDPDAYGLCNSCFYRSKYCDCGVCADCGFWEDECHCNGDYPSCAGCGEWEENCQCETFDDGSEG
jgi:hypothetical protein